MKRVIIIAVLALAACSPPTQKTPETSPATTTAPEAAATTLGALAIASPVANPPADGQTTGVGYMVISNGGETADRLVGASTPSASSVELHTHREVDGMMRMEKVDGVDIPAGGAAEFRPHGLHLMIFDFAPKGATMDVTLRFEKGGEVVVPFKVVARSAGQGETGHASDEEHEAH